MTYTNTWGIILEARRIAGDYSSLYRLTSTPGAVSRGARRGLRVARNVETSARIRAARLGIITDR